MALPTAAPALIDALVAFGNALWPVDEVQTVDSWARDECATKFIVSPPEAEVESDQSEIEHTEVRQEDLSVPCSVSTTPPEREATPKQARDHLLEVLAVLDAAIKADPTLGGAVQYARMGSRFQMVQNDSPTGDMAEIRFTVTAEAILQ